VIENSGIRSVGVVGSGLMGRQIALNTAKHGFKVRLTDTFPKSLNDAESWASAYLKGRVEKGKMTAGEAEGIVSRLRFEPDLAKALEGADLVIETVIEDEDAKRKILREVDRMVGRNCLIATNSSYFPSSLFKNDVSNPGRLANLHYFNPALVMELIEIVVGEHTSPETADALMAFSRESGKSPTLVKKEIDGFIVNRISKAIFQEGLYLYEGSYASMEDIDTAIEKGLNHPMGPFRLMDLVGLDFYFLVLKRQFEQSGVKPSGYDLLREKVEAGAFGRKSGKGWYDYA
jgi:3-hydroxybutyryl-CoA dehydrogenase